MLAAKAGEMAAVQGADGQPAQPPHAGSVVGKVAVPEVFNERAIVNQIARDQRLGGRLPQGDAAGGVTRGMDHFPLTVP